MNICWTQGHAEDVKQSIDEEVINAKFDCRSLTRLISGTALAGFFFSWIASLIVNKELIRKYKQFADSRPPKIVA